MILCLEAKHVTVKSSQSSGFIEFVGKAPQMFSGAMDGGLCHVIPQRGGEQHAVPSCLLTMSYRKTNRREEKVPRISNGAKTQNTSSSHGSLTMYCDRGKQ